MLLLLCSRIETDPLYDCVHTYAMSPTTTIPVTRCILRSHVMPIMRRARPRRTIIEGMTSPRVRKGGKASP